MDESIPAEEIIGAIKECIDAGYVRNIGLTQLTPENIERAAKVHPIHTLEFAYSAANRAIEQNGVLDTARKLGIPVLAFGVLQHGMLSRENGAFTNLKKLAIEKGTTVEKLVQAYVTCKHPDMSVLIGTTSKEHLQDSIDALRIEFTPEEIVMIESDFASTSIQGSGMRNIIFRDGRMER